MKIRRLIFLIIVMTAVMSCNHFIKSASEPTSWVRINQLGYLPQGPKTAVFCTLENSKTPERFAVADAGSNEIIWESTDIDSCGPYGPFSETYRLNLTPFSIQGKFVLLVDGTESPDFLIHPDVYDGSADFLLKYLRQQRCGFNPFLDDSCHTHDGFAVYEDGNNGNYVNVMGGWHDAADYLQYVTTSANAVFQLNMAYRDYPESFRDAYGADGLPGSNHIPDVIDEAKWGMDWLCRMNPAPDRFYNQIADDRDHAGFRLPNRDTVSYRDDGPGRPVYFCTGEVQGLKQHKNRATGTASAAGKFASAFAIGHETLAKFYPKYAESLLIRSRIAYGFGKQYPGVCQTAPCTAPYFYEEDNWFDDMELAAAELYRLTDKIYYKNEMLDFAKKEPVTPWMGSDTARHYQWYPFFNAGHYEAAVSLKGNEKERMTEKYFKGLQNIYERGRDNAFLMGVPFIWCSNNLVTAAMTQSLLYRKATGDEQFIEMEAALRDWLFGCNPWGTSMVVGLPAFGDTPVDPHSSLSELEGYAIDGGLVDGPVYTSIFNSLKGLRLLDEDEYAEFQSDLAVYHDDIGDYSTNEPTMDGSACLVYYLAAMESEGLRQSEKTASKAQVDQSGAICRGSQDKPAIALVFTGHEYSDGKKVIPDTLAAHNAKASFFFTGDFYRNPETAPVIKKLVSEGHYLGAHSDKHLLYNDWSSDKKRLVSEEEFLRDLENNYAEMKKFGIDPEDADYFMPPYEWNDERITLWALRKGITLVNFSQGTLSHTDYTIPENGINYHANDEIYNSIMLYEKQQSLNGFILLIHFGTSSKRPEKFYHELGRLMSELEMKGYYFVKIDELLDPMYKSGNISR